MGIRSIVSCPNRLILNGHGNCFSGVGCIADGREWAHAYPCKVRVTLRRTSSSQPRLRGVILLGESRSTGLVLCREYFAQCERAARSRRPLDSRAYIALDGGGVDSTTYCLRITGSIEDMEGRMSSPVVGLACSFTHAAIYKLHRRLPCRG